MPQTVVRPEFHALSSALKTDTGDLVALATTSRPVQGVAADGVTQTMVVIPSTTPGQSFTVSLLNDQGGPGIPSQDGALGQFGATSAQISQNSITVTADSNPSGPHFAIATYLAPTDFVRGLQGTYIGTCASQPAVDYDENLECRAVSINVTASGQSSQQMITIPVSIVRPPVMLLHGIWASPSAWDQFSPLFASAGGYSSSDAKFTISLLHYNDKVLVSANSSMLFPRHSTLALSRNALGFAFNAPFVASQIRSLFTQFRTGTNPILAPVAVTQADIVAHSMGGDIARFLTTDVSYLDDPSFRQGLIHKLITIDTPHKGSPLATDLFNPLNSCVASTMSFLGNTVVAQAILPTGEVIQGAVSDLQDVNSNGIFVSQGLNTINSFIGQPIPTAFIAADANAANYAGLQGTSALKGILYIFGCSNNPLYEALYPTTWSPTTWSDQIFNGIDNDGIVAVSSQLNNSGQGTVFPGLVHSKGTEQIGFTGPNVLDTADVAKQVILLLNTPVSTFATLNQ